MVHEDNHPTQSPVAAVPDRTSLRFVFKILMLILAVAAALWVIYRLRTVLLLLVLSIFFSFLIAPLVIRFEQLIRLKAGSAKLSRSAAITAVYLSLSLLMVILAYGLLPSLAAQVSAFISHLPEYAAKARSSFERLEWLYKNQAIPPEWQRAILAESGHISQTLFESIGTGLLKIVALTAFLPWLILVPVLSFFMLEDAEVFREAMVSAFPTRRLRSRMDVLFQDASLALAAYMRAQLVACLLVGVVCSVGFKLLGTPYPLVFGVGAGILEFIPLAGPLLTAIIAFLVSATVSFKLAFYILIFLLVFRVLEDYVIYPRLIGHGLKMHPLAIIVAVLSGAELGGVIGIFLAVPAVALMTVFYRHWLEYRGGQGIMADLLEPAAVVPSQPTFAPSQIQDGADVCPRPNPKD